MKIEFDYPEEMLKAEVFGIVTRRMADKIYDEDHGSFDRVEYRKALKDAVKTVVQEHSDDIVERSIPKVAEYAGKKVIRKLPKGEKVEFIDDANNPELVSDCEELVSDLLVLGRELNQDDKTEMAELVLNAAATLDELRPRT